MFLRLNHHLVKKYEQVMVIDRIYDEKPIPNWKRLTIDSTKLSKQKYAKTSEKSIMNRRRKY